MIFKTSAITWMLSFLAIQNPGSMFTSGACLDTHAYCAGWAKQGQCQTNYLWMLQKCPKSCQVCSGGVVCVNKYNDQYCLLHAGNCWRKATAVKLVNNCRKTCVCSCCPAIPVTTATTTTAAATTTTTKTTKTTKTTTVTSTKASTAPQTTTEKTGDERTTALTSLSTQKPSVTKETNTLATAANDTYNSREEPTGATQRSGFNPALLSAIVVGVAVVIAILGISLFCFWRKKRSASLQQPTTSPPSTESPEIPITETTPNSPIYQVLEMPDDTYPRNDEVLPLHSEQSSDYDEPTEQKARAMIGSSSNARENHPQYEAVDKDRNPKRFMNDPSNCPTIYNSPEYCYSYSVANEDIFLQVHKNGLHEAPNVQGPRYHALERPNTKYQSLEKSAAAGKNGDVEAADESCEVMRDIDPTGYQDLSQTTQSFYHPLQKTDEQPRRK